MSTIKYTLVPDSGPSLDRLANSWRYCDDPTAQVLVTFTATRRHCQPGTEPFDVTIKVIGKVRGLLHRNSHVVEVQLDVIQNGKPLHEVLVTVRYGHKSRVGELDWVITR